MFRTLEYIERLDRGVWQKRSLGEVCTEGVQKSRDIFFFDDDFTGFHGTETFGDSAGFSVFGEDIRIGKVNEITVTKFLQQRFFPQTDLTVL